MPSKESVPFSVVLFYSISGALRAEKLLKKEGLTFKLIPVPRQLSSDCGICLRFERTDEERIRVILARGGPEIQRIAHI